MRPIVATVWAGYAPTLVSAESITASAPSKTALATSETSARVGRRSETIESSMWVATITGLAACRHRSMARFCTKRNLLQRHLHTEVTAGHHQSVERADDRRQVRNRLGFLEFRHDRHPLADLVHDGVRELDLLGSPDERHGDHVDTEFERELQVLDVLLGQRRNADRNARQRNALVVADGPAVHDLTA